MYSKESHKSWLDTCYNFQQVNQGSTVVQNGQILHFREIRLIANLFVVDVCLWMLDCGMQVTESGLKPTLWDPKKIWGYKNIFEEI